MFSDSASVFNFACYRRTGIESVCLGGFILRVPTSEVCTECQAPVLMDLDSSELICENNHVQVPQAAPAPIYPERGDSNPEVAPCEVEAPPAVLDYAAEKAAIDKQFAPMAQDAGYQAEAVAVAEGVAVQVLDAEPSPPAFEFAAEAPQVSTLPEAWAVYPDTDGGALIVLKVDADQFTNLSNAAESRDMSLSQHMREHFEMGLANGWFGT